jgi:hypothetical protein
MRDCARRGQATTLVAPEESKPDSEDPTCVNTSTPAAFRFRRGRLVARSQRSLELGVAAIAKDATFAALAATKVCRLGFYGLEFYRREAAAGVASVTEGLRLAQSTGTPVVARACFNLNGIWTFLRDRWY